MICTVTFDHVVADILIGIVGPDIDQTVRVMPGHGVSADLEYVPKYGCNYRLFAQTNDPRIITAPSAIVSIGFDRFFTFKSLLIYKGHNVYSDEYIEHCRTNHVTVDTTVNDNNLLFFTGSLDYTITHPAILNVNGKAL
jgi:hypothetical protein